MNDNIQIGNKTFIPILNRFNRGNMFTIHHRMNTVRVKFIKNNSTRHAAFLMKIYVGKCILDKLDLKIGDHVTIGYLKDNTKEFCIMKTTDQNLGYTVSKPSKTTKNYSSLTVTIDFFEPTEIQKTMFICEHRIINNVLSFTLK